MRGADGLYKTITLTFRIKLGLKEALRTAVQPEHRSIASLIKVVIRQFCDKAGVQIADPSTHWAKESYMSATISKLEILP